MNVVLLATLLLCVGELPGLPSGVRLPEGQSFAERAAVVADGGVSVIESVPDHVFTQHLQSELPPTDKGDFYLILYTDRRSPESRLLVEDFNRHPALRVLRDWAKFTVIDRETPGAAGMGVSAAEARHMAQELAASDIPTVLVLSNPDHPVFGRREGREWRHVYAAAGYGGDAGLLARNIYNALTEYYQSHDVPIEQCPGPYCPDPRNPDRPHWPPVEPRTPRQPDDGWTPPRLPRLDDPPTIPLPWLPSFDPSSWPWWAWLLIGAGALWLLRTFGPRAGCVMLLAVLVGSPTVAADGPMAGTDAPVERPDPPYDQEMPDKAEWHPDREIPGGAFILPPAPRDWEWLDRSVRDEVRRALDPPRIEALLRLSLNHVEVRVENAVAGVEASIRRAVDGVYNWMLAMALCNAATLALLGYLAWRQHQRD